MAKLVKLLPNPLGASRLVAEGKARRRAALRRGIERLQERARQLEVPGPEPRHCNSCQVYTTRLTNLGGLLLGCIAADFRTQVLILQDVFDIYTFYFLRPIAWLQT